MTIRLFVMLSYIVVCSTSYTLHIYIYITKYIDRNQKLMNGITKVSLKKKNSIHGMCIYIYIYMECN